MRVELFDFELPEARIAQAPLPARDGARLLHVADGLHDRTVRDVPSQLNAGDVLVFNQSKVIPARLFTQVGDKQIEVLLHQPTARGSCQWRAFARPARKLKEGMRVAFAADFFARIDGRTDDGQVILTFDDEGSTLFAKLHTHGHMPLPPYIKRGDDAADATRYQTVFARDEGSVAAPTAGLHFTESLLRDIQARGVHIAYVTLHVGAGTFQPVKVEDTDAHIMHREWYEIDAANAAIINAARANGGNVIAVGTTSLRTLESAASADGTLAAVSADTGIFITPGYRFKLVNRLITNFHLPKSTLFMLVAAFSGLDRMQAAYAHAIQHGYRFYSYGDACLLERAS